MPTKKKMYYGWWIVITTTVMAFTLVANPFSVVLKQLMTEFGSGRGMISLGQSISMFAGGISGLFISKLIINHRPKTFMLWGSVITGICLLLISLSHSLWYFYILSFVSGITGAGAGALTMFTMISRWFKKKWGTAIGITMLGGSVGSLIITPIVGLIAQNLGWRATYIFASALVLFINVPLIIFILKDSPAQMGLAPDGTDPVEYNRVNISQVAQNIAVKPVNKRGFAFFLKSLPVWLLGITFTLISMGDAAVTQHQVSFLTDMGISATLAASALGFTMGISGIGKFAAGWLADRFSSRYVTMVFLTIELAGMVVLIHAHNMSTVWVFVVVYGLCTGAATTLLPCVITEAFGTANFSILFALGDIFYRVGATIGTPLAGFIFDATNSYSFVFVLVIIFYILAMITVYFTLGVNPKPLKRRLK